MSLKNNDEILAMEPGPELNALVAVEVMEWIFHPYPAKDAREGVWLNRQEGFAELQWTGYITGHIYGFRGDMHTRLEDSSVLTSCSVPGKIWEPSSDWGMMGQTVSKMREHEKKVVLEGWIGTTESVATFFDTRGRRSGHAMGDSAPEAVSKAALIARRGVE